VQCAQPHKLLAKAACGRRLCIPALYWLFAPHAYGWVQLNAIQWCADWEVASMSQLNQQR